MGTSTYYGLGMTYALWTKLTALNTVVFLGVPKARFQIQKNQSVKHFIHKVSKARKILCNVSVARTSSIYKGVLV